MRPFTRPSICRMRNSLLGFVARNTRASKKVLELTKILRGERVWQAFDCFEIGDPEPLKLYSPSVEVPDDWEPPVDVEDALDWEDDREARD